MSCLLLRLCRLLRPAGSLLTLTVMGACGGGGGDGGKGPPTGPGGGTTDPAPTVSAVSPTSFVAGTSGGTLTITGSSFVARSVVAWNGSARPTTWTSATQLEATLSAADLATAGSAAVTVITAAPGGGTSSAIAVEIRNPAPMLSALLPSASRSVGDVAPLTVRGRGFTAASRVHWKGVERPTSRIDDSTLTIQIAAADVAAPDSVRITVVTPAPGGGTSMALVLEVRNPAPNVRALVPTALQAGQGATDLRVIGTGFTAGSRVHWNGAERPTTRADDSTLVAALPATDVAEAGTARVTVVTPAPGGGTSAPLDIVIRNPAPVLRALAPATLEAGAGAMTLRVIGSGFVAASRVHWNGGERPTTRANDSTLVADLSAADVATAGTFRVTVVTPAPGGGTSDTLPLTITPRMNPTPVLTRLDPDSVPAGNDAFTLRLTGDGFVTGTVARWNGSARPTTVVNATRLEVAITAADVDSAGTATVTVFTPAPGGGTSAAKTMVITAPVIVADRKLAMMETSACRIENDGSTRCWGDGERMLIGNGGSMDQLTPVAINGAHRFRTVAGSSYQACGVTEPGVLWCWGPYPDVPSIPQFSSSPMRIQTPEPVMAVDISTTLYYCVVGVSGQAYCRSSQNTYGQRGGGVTGDANSGFVAVVGDHKFAAIAVGRAHACALTGNGETWCWGEGTYIGSRTGTLRNPTPLRVPDAPPFVRISAGDLHTCALTAAGEAWCWGRNSTGALGTGNTTLMTAPTRVSTSERFVDISAGTSHTCAVSTGGDVWCWGEGELGRLGSGDEVDRLLPQRVSVSGARFRAVLAGWESTCAIDVSGATWCWGTEQNGALGNGRSWIYSTPQRVGNLDAVVQVDAFARRVCALREGGEAWCWGSHAASSAESARWYEASSAVPVRVAGTTSFTKIATGAEHSCGLDASGGAWCWGQGGNGRLGNGATAGSETPVRVSGNRRFSTLSAGHAHTCGLEADKLWCWGMGANGRLGNGGTADAAEPVEIRLPNGAPIGAVAAGSISTCVLDRDGVAYCWGGDGIGAGTTYSSTTPQRVQTTELFRSIANGTSLACGITLNGSTLCWGDNDGGRRGFPAGQIPDPGNVPATLQTTMRFDELSTGGLYHMCGKAANNFACWGTANYGEFGDGATAIRKDIPVLVVPALSFIQRFTTGFNLTCGIDGERRVRCWGAPTAGALGNGHRGFQAQPVRVGVVQ